MNNVSSPLNFYNSESDGNLFDENFISPGPLRRKSYQLLPIKNYKQRAVLKNGNCNVVQIRTFKLSLKYFQDYINTLIDCRWRWTLLWFSISFFGSWLIFALIWWIVALAHGDLVTEHLPENQKRYNWTPCVTSIEGFTSTFLFSVETQITTGYGTKVITDECPEAIIVMCLQSIIGLTLQVVMVSIVFAKMTRPKVRTQTIQFSKNAVISQRDGHMCLMARLGDTKKSHIIGATITAHIIHNKQTKEGDVLKNYQTEIIVKADSCSKNIFLIWPLTIVHRIDKHSPLYYISANDLVEGQFEIAFILDGTMENTGQATQARTSYLSNEIIWGYKFNNVVSYNNSTNTYEVDYTNFNSTIPIDMSYSSAAENNGLITSRPPVSASATRIPS